MSLITKVNALATAIGQDIKGILAGMGLLSALNTTAKDSLVEAINEVNSKPAGGESNTASNLGTTGIGIFSAKSGVDLQFKKLAASGSVSLAQNATTITLSINEGVLQGYVDSAEIHALSAEQQADYASQRADDAQTYAIMAQEAAAGNVIDDATTTTLKAWSSQKVVDVLSGYSVSTHNHDSAYAAAGHDHSGVYAPAAHNHDSAYAAASHNHDSAYAAATHNHVSAGISDFSEAVDARIQANGPKITVGTTAPASPAVGDLWVDMN